MTRAEGPKWESEPSEVRREEGRPEHRAPLAAGLSHLPSAVWLTAVTNSPRTSWTHPPFHPGQSVWGPTRTVFPESSETEHLDPLVLPGLWDPASVIQGISYSSFHFMTSENLTNFFPYFIQLMDKNVARDTQKTACHQKLHSFVLQTLCPAITEGPGLERLDPWRQHHLRLQAHSQCQQPCGIDSNRVSLGRRYRMALL